MSIIYTMIYDMMNKIACNREVWQIPYKTYNNNI